MSRQHYSADSFHLQDSIGYLVKRTQHLMRDRIETVFASQGITFQQWVVLMHLRDGIAATTAGLCEELRHDSGAMTRLIDQLEERGFIERQRQSADRRVVNLALTSAGRKMVESLVPLTVDTLNDALAGFTKADVQQLQSLLRRIIARVGDLNGEDDEAAPVLKVKS
ncbi:MAG TPA: MarR family winged helix-turn-helix transcriptional regulator [Steroidobacteraceae bacterium]|nr:MarR family winged helix-turn-helix transcriptional regulator [Steroidobacteraceae bacterium]